LKVTNRIRGRLRIAGIGVAIVSMLGIAATVFLRRPSNRLPYHDSFASGQAGEWTAFGGIWELANGVMRNDSDERGAKLVTGSAVWKDYSFSGDVELLGQQGDAGLMLRSGDEERGVDSYRGYYVGLRSNDDNLIIGLADHGWIELAARPMPGGVHPFQWYHLKGAVRGCQITAIATEISTRAFQATSVIDKDCVPQGRVGLRSHSSGGVWKNLEVLPSTASESNLPQASPSVTPPKLSYAVDEPVVGRISNPDRPNASSSKKQQIIRNRPGGATANASPVESISGLRLIRTKSRRATTRGTVILNYPSLYVQDATGGVAVIPSSETHLKIGDEVEVTGEVDVHDFSCVIRNANIRLLWAHAPAPAVAVTAGQAATGAFDARFIEVDGDLWAKEAGPDNTLLLTLKSDGQSFQAIIHEGRGNAIARSISRRSHLRLRGVCVVDSLYTHNLTPFVLLIPSSDDLEVLAGAPWWSARNLLIIGLLSLTLALLAYLLYIHAKHWRLQAIVEERERIAHEMHDTLAQCFVGIGFQLQAISNGMPKSMHAINEQIDLACELVRHSHEEASRSLSTLRREFLESEPLHSALNAFACRMVEHGSIKVLTTVEGEGAPTPYRIKDALFRIGQEAIANAVRHGNPSVLKIQVDYRNAAVMMLIADNGGGFTPSGDLRGFGLTGMRKRAEGIAGALHLSSIVGSGTQVKVVAPLPPKLTLLKVNSYVRRQGTEGGSNDPRNDKKNPYSYRR
jgi:signal transduction histidine kinase